MGRRRQAYKLEKRGNGIWYVVGTTPDGRRVHRSTRTHSRKTASQRLPLIVEQVEVGARATFSEVTNTPLEELLARWLTSAAPEVSSAQGDGSLFETYARQLRGFFQTTELIAQATEMIGCGREDSCVTGIWQSGADGVRVAARFQVQYAGPERGRVDRRFDVLVDTSVTFTKDWVRKRGLEPPRVLPH